MQGLLAATTSEAADTPAWHRRLSEHVLFLKFPHTGMDATVPVVAAALRSRAQGARWERAPS